MIGYHNASSALTLLVLLTGASFLHLSTTTPGNFSNPHRDTLPGLWVSREEQRKDEEIQSLEKEKAGEEEELFEDVDPKTLAAVLLEALNLSHVETRRKGQGHDGMEEHVKDETGETKKEHANRKIRMMEGADRDRDGRQELELLMAAQGKEQEKKQEEIKKAQEEEEKMTEKVTSHTTSQTIQAQTERKLVSPDKEGEKGHHGTNTPEYGSSEEQLNPEELKSLETIMKESPRLNTATKRVGNSELNQRESRGYSSYSYKNIIPVNKGSDLAMSKKKLKWQEETQKAMNFPTVKGNFLDDFENSNYAGSKASQSQTPAQQEVTEDNEPEEEEDEELLSPEEEEARAKGEQEEIRRQTAEAQRAKMEEERLADIASDMLLRYMIKQNNGNKKHSSSFSNALEDKRSDEEQEVMEEDDIDPQTIDKLIEISSKLHLPADDVVDIISDVEKKKKKKKKKDVPPEMMSHWQQPPIPLSSSLSSTNGFLTFPISTNQNKFPISKQSSSAFNLLKTRFQGKSPIKSQDLWSKVEKSLLANQNPWPGPQKPLSVKQELWIKSPKSGYPFYPYTHPSYHQMRPYPDYYPIYFPPLPRPKPRYNAPKSIHTLNNFLGNSLGNTYNFTPKHNYHSWVQPRLRKPPASLQQKPYYISYPLSLYPRTFQPIPIPQPHSPPQVIPPPQKQFYYPAPAVTRNDDYFVVGKQPDSSHDDLEKYIQQILMKRLQILD